MSEQLGILLGLLVLGYIFLSPIVLIILYVKQKKTIRWLEEELRILKDSFQEQREKAARMSPANMEQEDAQAQASEAKPLQEKVPEPESVVQAESAKSHIRETVSAPEQEPKPEPVLTPVSAAPARSVDTLSLSEKVRPFLQGVGMWPPSREEGKDRETVLMQWWLPRVGGLLALLSALFFGVYINQNTSPLFKCLELIAVSLGVSGLGWFMERKYRTFGGVLLVTGLIMLYMTSVAAYTLRATQVIENPVVGSIIQGLVLVGICALGLMRKSMGLVLLTFHFGYFLGLFMVHEGLREGALVEAGLLFVAGMMLSGKELFRPLAWVVVPGSYLVVLAFPILDIFKAVALPGSLSVQIFVNLVFAGIIVSYFIGLLWEGKFSRILLSLGTSLAILSTFLFYRVFYPNDLEWASLVLGIVMLAGSLVGWNRRGCGFIAQLLFINASFLIGVWAILHFAGDLRWMILALQTVVVAAAARRARVIAMELLVWAVACVSLYYFMGALGGGLAQGTFVWWMMVLYPLVITLAMAFMAKPFECTIERIKGINRIWAYAIVPGFAINLWNILFEQTTQRGFDMALPFILLIYIAGGLSLVPFICKWMMLELAAFAFLLGCGHYCDEPFSIIQLAGIVIASATALHFLTRKSDKWAIVSESVLYLLTIIPVTLWLLQVMDNWLGQAIIVYVLCASVVLAGLVPRFRQIGSWGFLPLVIFMLTENASVGAGVWNLIAFAAGLGWLVIPVILPQVKNGMGWAKNVDIWALIGGALFWFYAILFGDPEATWMAGQWVLAILAILLLLGSYRWRMHGYMLAAILFAFSVTLRHFLAMDVSLSYSPWKSEALMSAGLIYTFALLWFFLKPNPFADQPEPTPKLILTLSSGASAILLFTVSVMTFQYKDLGWLDWYTPLLAITAFLMILLGLFFRDSIFRRMGLLALLVPLIRLFLVDVQDVLHRIIAFAASAVLLTVLGYLYHRLASRLSEEQLNEDSPAKGD